jgi:hypothetical protein
MSSASAASVKAMQTAAADAASHSLRGRADLNVVMACRLMARAREPELFDGK